MEETKLSNEEFWDGCLSSEVNARLECRAEQKRLDREAWADTRLTNKEPFAVPFPQRLREMRVSRGWSQAKLAEKAKVSEKSVKRWEAGAARPYGENRILLAEALEVPIEELGE